MKNLYKKIRLKAGVWVVRLVRRQHGVVIFYNDKERRSMLDFAVSLPYERTACLSNHEAYQLMMLVKQTNKIPGDIAEIGCYKGGSARLIEKYAGEREIFLFDTFEGLPPLEEIDRSAFDDGMFVADYEDVKRFFSYNPRIHIYKGLFPEDSAQHIKDKRFSFVHIDVDLYQGMKASLEFLYPRMNSGGVMLFHDYWTAEGARKAVEEFFADKPEFVIDSSWRQCFIVKR